MSNFADFQIISIDVPWDYPRRSNKGTRFGLGMSRYEGMKKEAIYKLPVGDLAATNAALFFWVTAPKIRANYIPLEIMFTCFRRWGFDYKTKAFCWVKLSQKKKQRILPGHYTASNTEDCYLAIRGRLPLLRKLTPQILFTTQVFPHSRKPGEAQARMLEMYGDRPRVELFATEQTPGWVAWGQALTGKQTMEEFFKL